MKTFWRIVDALLILGCLYAEVGEIRDGQLGLAAFTAFSALVLIGANLLVLSWEEREEERD